MKQMLNGSNRIGIVAVVASLFAIDVFSQTSVETTAQETTPWAVSQRTAHSKIWERVEYETRPDGRKVPHVRSYTELATGLHYQKDGQWIDSKEEIQILPDGAGGKADQGQHKVIFPPNLFAGVIELNTPDNKWIRSRVVGLSYLDSASGKSVLIAEVQNCAGEVSGNQVWYRDAFSGLKADVRLTYTRAAYEQDIILRESPASPINYGLNPETTRLQVLTEFFDPPELSKQVLEIVGLRDEMLDFGAMQIGPSKAFALGEETQGSGERVTKTWDKLESRDFLIEEVEYKRVEQKLQALPVASVAAIEQQVSSNSVLNRVVIGRVLPTRHFAKHSTNAFQMAKADVPSRPGYVLDYTIVNSQSGYVFDGDKTYFVSGTVNLSGTTTLEGGAVIKYAQGASLQLAYNPKPINCQTAPYRPCVFTDKNDDSIGEVIDGSTGTPYGGGNPALSTIGGSTACALKNVRFSYQNNAIWAMGILAITNAQFAFGGPAITMVSGGAITLRNVLFYNVPICFNNLGNGGVGGQHVTVYGCPWIATRVNQYCSVSLMNSVLANVGNLWAGSLPIQFSGSYNGFYSSPYFGATESQFTDNDYPFEAAGNGNCYLRSDSPFRNVGATSVDVNLLASLRNKTTFPPIIYTDETFTDPQTLPKQPIRDTDAPDLGYHYDSLDYAFGGCHAEADLTFASGTAVGWFRTSYGWNHQGHGIHVGDRKVVTFDGTFGSPCYWVRTPTVQEGVSAPWAGGNGTGGITSWADQNGPIGDAAEVRGRFLICSMMSGDCGNHFRDDHGILIGRFKDSELYVGGAGCYVSSYYFTNCLFYRSGLGINEGVPGNELYLWNCTWYKGVLNVIANRSPVWTVVQDCAFDGTSVAAENYGRNPSWAHYDYNAFKTGESHFPRPECGGINDRTVSSFGWLVGLLGGFYLPSGSVLVDHGSRSASVAGLFPYTTRVDQTIEGNSQVDIGFHYLPWGFNQLAECEGVMVNLETTPEGYLRIKPTADTSPLPFVSLANSERDTVLRIEVPNQCNPSLTESKVVGEYYTRPNGGGDPSRTTVDRYGNVWVGNRAEGSETELGSIAQIGVMIGGTNGIKSPENAPRGAYTFTANPNGQWRKPPDNGGGWYYSTCVDRDGDGLIRTSAGLESDGSMAKVLAWNDPLGDDSPGGVSKAVDEAITRYVRVVPTKVRSIAVDRDNNIWTGSRNNAWHEYVDGQTGSPVTGWKFRFGIGGYGALVDGYGVLWSSGRLDSDPQYSWEPQVLLRFIPDSAQPPGTAGGVIPYTGSGYGIGIDPLSGDLWVGNYDVGTLWRFSEGGCTKVFSFNGNVYPYIRGIVVDGKQNVWVAQSDGTVVHHLRTSGEYVGDVPLDHPSLPGVVGKYPYGVCVDSDGMIWAVCYEKSLPPDEKHYAMRIDPNQNPPSDPSHNPPIGRVVEAVRLGNGAYPYNYSDMSGFVTLSTTKPAGFWDFIKDSTVNDTLWTRVGTVAEIPANADVIVEVRAANYITELPSWPFQRVEPDGTMPAGMNIKGRFLEVRITLLRDFCPGATCAGPVLKALYAESGAAGGTLQITSHPANKVVDAGQSTSLSVVAPGALSYEWFKDGVQIPGDLATLTLVNVQCTDAGVYCVRVGNAGCTLQSAPARLHVKGATPELNLVSGDLPDQLYVTPGQNETISAHVTVAGAGSCSEPGYQWRHNDLPIPGASGPCTSDGGNGWLASLTLNDVQCEDAGMYSVVFSNAYGSILSSAENLWIPISGAATELIVNGTASLEVTPADVTVYDASLPVSFTAGTCVDMVCAQWFRNGVAIPGADALEYTVEAPIACEDIGYYKIQVYDSAYRVYEATAWLSPASDLEIQRATFTANAGTGWSYQWYFSLISRDGPWTPIGSEPTWVVNHSAPPSSRDGYYQVIATQSGQAGRGAVLYVYWESQNMRSHLLGSTNLTVNATYRASSGIGSLGHTWYFPPPNDTTPAGSGAEYTVSPLNTAVNGWYHVMEEAECAPAQRTSQLLIQHP